MYILYTICNMCVYKSYTNGNQRPWTQSIFLYFLVGGSLGFSQTICTHTHKSSTRIHERAHKTVCERRTGIRHTFAEMIHTKYVKKCFYTPTFSHIKMYTAVKFFTHTPFSTSYTRADCTCVTSGMLGLNLSTYRMQYTFSIIGRKGKERKREERKGNDKKKKKNSEKR